MNTVVEKTIRVTAPVAVAIFVACVLSGCRSSSSEPAPAVEDRAMEEAPGEPPAPAVDEAPVDLGYEGEETPPPPSAEEEVADEDPSDQY